MSPDAALDRYRRRIRPLRLLYAGALVVVVAVALLLLKIAYVHGEISHTTLVTVPKGLPSVGVTVPHNGLSQAWSSTDATAIGAPYSGGTVVTWDDHTVRGRNARTGEPTWSYTRTDRTVCAAMQDNGSTIAVYRLHGDCDELTGLSTDTGEREWTRTLDADGAGFDGPAQFSVVDGNFFFVSQNAIYNLQGSGGDWWKFHHVGCTINSAVLGTSGALISQTCTGLDCSSTAYCGNGPQLLLRAETDSYDEKNTVKIKGVTLNNYDRIVWNSVGSTLVPTDAGSIIAGRQPGGGALRLLSSGNGKQYATVRLTGSSGASAPAAVAPTTNADLIWIGGHTYALRSTTQQVAWRATTPSIPTVYGAGDVEPSLATARLTVPTSSGVATLNPGTGRAARTFPVGAPPGGSMVYPLGAGFLVAGTHTAVYH